METDQNAIAKNKLLLLYIMQKAAIKISDNRLISICNDLSLMDYFDLSTSLSELEENGLIQRTQSINGTFYQIGEMGISTLEFFEKELRMSQRQRIAAYCEEQREAMRMESQLFAEYIRLGEHQFRVTLRILENDVTSFEINFFAATKAEADRLVQGWKKNAMEAYHKVFETLLA
ncbi:MAG: DUF4364 family protein [Christensenellaceae bacterium]|nr:DUF4364 family protein [Christensenellaceae bacterium]